MTQFEDDDVEAIFSQPAPEDFTPLVTDDEADPADVRDEDVNPDD